MLNLVIDYINTRTLFPLDSLLTLAVLEYSLPNGSREADAPTISDILTGGKYAILGLCPNTIYYLNHLIYKESMEKNTVLSPEYKLH